MKLFERKETFGRGGRSYGHNIMIDPTGLLCEGVDWIFLVQARDQWYVLVNWTFGIYCKKQPIFSSCLSLKNDSSPTTSLVWSFGLSLLPVSVFKKVDLKFVNPLLSVTMVRTFVLHFSVECFPKSLTHGNRWRHISSKNANKRHTWLPEGNY
jgi:hypothetical protein